MLLSTGNQHVFSCPPSKQCPHLVFPILRERQKLQGDLSTICPPGMMSRMADIFVRSGYSPFDESGSPLDPAGHQKWFHKSLVWVHEKAPKIFPKK